MAKHYRNLVLPPQKLQKLLHVGFHRGRVVVSFESEIYPKALNVSFKIDGEWIEARLLRPEFIIRTIQFANFSTSPTTCRELLFSRLELTDDDAFLNVNVKGLGEISVYVWEGTVGEVCSGTTQDAPEKKVHERSKKALGHQVKFGEEKPMKPQTYRSFTASEMLATFIFKYRSIDILRADGIAPPDPAANKRKADEAVESDEYEDRHGDEGEDEGEDEDDERELKALLVNLITQNQGII